MQGNAFDAPERVGEVRRRRTNRSRDVDESNRAGQVRFEELLRAADQSTRRPARLAGSTVSVERGTKERDHPLLEIGFVPIRRRGTLQKTTTQLLQLEAGSPAAALKQGMKRQGRTRALGDFIEQFRIWRDDQLGVVGRAWLAQMVAFAPRDEQHLIGIADDIVAADVPDEQAAIRQTHLKVG